MEDQSIDEIYRENVDLVYRYCLFRTGSPHAAEDITAEAFSRLIAANGRVTGERVRPWLLKVARNLSVDESRRRRKVAEGAAPPDRGEPFPDGDVWIDTDVRDAVERLNPAEQQAIFLRLVEDLSFADIAAVVGRGEASTRVLYGRALKKLRVMLERGEKT